jgi:biopolymer transport protein ExbD
MGKISCAAFHAAFAPSKPVERPMRFRHTGGAPAKIQLEMTPMIDVVFQLLAFFLLSLRIAMPEGDFSIKMPRSASQTVPDPSQLPPLKVRLVAAESGELAEIRFNDQSFGQDFDRLQAQLITLLGDDRGPDSMQAKAELELAADFDLHYRHTAEAISRVSGYFHNGRIIKLIERIRFQPPSRGLGEGD